MVRLRVGIEGGTGAGFVVKVEAGLQVKMEVEDEKVLGILGLWRYLRFCWK